VGEFGATYGETRERLHDHAVTEAILARRSVREGYSNKSVPVGVLEEIVMCGLAAPSSKNAQPWRLHVVCDPEALHRIAALVEGSERAEQFVPHDPETGAPHENLSSSVRESAQVLRSCGAGIFIENRGVFSRGIEALAVASSERRRAALAGYAFEILGVGAAIQNMWIAASALGVQGVFMGDVVIAESAIRSEIAIECDLLGVLALGYSNVVEGGPRREIDMHDSVRAAWY